VRVSARWFSGIGADEANVRESTGSILASVVTHAVLDVLVIVPGLISGT
jgi:hypothetical protein